MDAKLLLTQEDRDIIDSLKGLLSRIQTPVPEVLLSNNEAARILGVSPGYIPTLLKRKKLVKRTIGKSRGILLEDVLKYRTR